MLVRRKIMRVIERPNILLNYIIKILDSSKEILENFSFFSLLDNRIFSGLKTISGDYKSKLNLARRS